GRAGNDRNLSVFAPLRLILKQDRGGSDGRFFFLPFVVKLRSESGSDLLSRSSNRSHPIPSVPGGPGGHRLPFLFLLSFCPHSFTGRGFSVSRNAAPVARNVGAMGFRMVCSDRRKRIRVV